MSSSPHEKSSSKLNGRRDSSSEMSSGASNRERRPDGSRDVPRRGWRVLAGVARRSREAERIEARESTSLARRWRENLTFSLSSSSSTWPVLLFSFLSTWLRVRLIRSDARRSRRPIGPSSSSSSSLSLSTWPFFTWPFFTWPLLLSTWPRVCACWSRSRNFSSVILTRSRSAADVFFADADDADADAVRRDMYSSSSR